MTEEVNTTLERFAQCSLMTTGVALQARVRGTDTRETHEA